MNTNQSSVHDQLTECLRERMFIAEQLQNEVNQTLASVLLWIQHAKMENSNLESPSLTQAEKNLKAAIVRLRDLHYSLSKDL